ncbi:MAG: translation initiation factor IF-2 [Longimicrobiales bacterium]|nr:translation initiation factor IF-2 [Longimicrobiales bacterium]
MRVEELAQDLKMAVDVLLPLLRGMGIHVARPGDEMGDAEAALVLARVERARRAGKSDARAALEAAVEESAPATRRRRRRRTPEPEPEPEVSGPEAEEAAEEEVETEEPAAAEVSEAEVTGKVASKEMEEGARADAAGDAEAAADAREEAADAREEAEDAASGESTEEVVAEAEGGEAPDRVAAAEAAGEGQAATPEPEAGVAPDSDGPAPTPVRDAAGSPEPVRRFRKPRPAAQGGPTGPAASAGPGGTVRIQAEGYTADGQRKRKDRKKRRVDQDEVQENLQRVMAQMKGGGKKKRKKTQRPTREEIELQEMEREEERERERKTVRVNEFLTVAELAELVDESPTAIVGSAFKNLGLMVTINQRLDFDQIELLLDEFGYTAVREEEYEALGTEEVEEEDPESLRPRPPVVTVMGHVDHGKTLLLDRIRSTNVVAGESGGITQHIGAYHVELPDGRSISFLDTPGHAAFTAMRARGADLTDVVILIVAADDSVMPQTVEAISHAKNADVPMVVAINKVDLPAADPMRVKQELLQHDVQVEDFGGDVLCAEISAKTGAGIDDLLEKVLLQAEMLELQANPDRPAQGVVVEAQLDVGKGPVVTIMVQKGTLRVGDSFVCGLYDGRVRALLDERGKSVSSVGPAVPAQVLGAAGVPQAGDTFQAMGADEAGEVATSRQRLDREKQLRIRDRGLKLGDFGHMLAKGQISRLPLIIKGDVDGSVQAVADALEQLSTGEVQVEVVHRAVGAVNESDVLLAETAGAVIIGFRVRPDANARHLAEEKGVEIKTYEVIYHAVDDVRAALEGMLSPEQREEILGAAEVREIFRISRVGTIAGCYVTEGLINRKGRARLIRDGIVQYDGELSSLKRFKDDVREVREGFECGIGIQNFNDLKVGDVIECYRVEEIARTLAESAQAGA